MAITSDKPQTTRRRIFGVANGPDYQLVLADLPGFQRPRPLTEHMQRTVDSSFEDVDAVLFVLDARDRIGSGDRFIAKRVFELGVPVVIVVNKVDRLKPGHIASQMQTASQLGDFHALHPVSAKTGDGVEGFGTSSLCCRMALPTFRPISAPTSRSRSSSRSSSARRRFS